MKRWKVFVLGCLAACMSFALMGCASQKYEPADKTPIAAASSLKQSGTLRVGVNADAAPLAGQTSSSSQIVGIDVDVAAAIADQLGVKVQIVDVGTNPEAALSAGTVDIVCGIEESGSDTTFWKSEAYLSTGVALFGPSTGATVPSVSAGAATPSIAAQVSSKSAWRVTNLFGDEALAVQNDLKSAFAALKSGSVDYVASDAVIGTYVAHTGSYDAKAIALLQDPSGYCVGVASPNTELQAAVSAAVTALRDGGIIDIIEAKWLGAALDFDSLTVLKAAASRDATAAASGAGTTGATGGTSTDSDTTSTTGSAGTVAPSTSTDATAAGQGAATSGAVA